MKWIGLTGGIATGKSTVARLLESLGCPVIDADQISHQVTQFGQPGYLQAVSHFGPSILNENQDINRKKLSQIIFLDQQKKLELENILHPLIHEKVEHLKSDYHKKGFELCIYDVPLLFEKKMKDQFDAVTTVWCEPHIQMQRLMARNTLGQAEALLRIQNQLPLATKISQSKYCIDNSGSEKSLIQIVSNWLKKA